MDQNVSQVVSLTQTHISLNKVRVALLYTVLLLALICGWIAIYTSGVMAPKQATQSKQQSSSGNVPIIDQKNRDISDIEINVTNLVTDLKSFEIQVLKDSPLTVQVLDKTVTNIPPKGGTFPFSFTPPEPNWQYKILITACTTQTCYFSGEPVACSGSIDVGSGACITGQPGRADFVIKEFDQMLQDVQKNKIKGLPTSTSVTGSPTRGTRAIVSPGTM